MVALAQSVSIARAGNAVTVRAPGFDFIKGEPLDRLKDGRSVRVDLELDVLPGPGGAAAAQGRQTYVLSYDLWEERFAVTLVGPPPRSIAYLTSVAAETWCLEQLTVPVSALGRLGREAALLGATGLSCARRRQPRRTATAAAISRCAA